MADTFEVCCPDCGASLGYQDASQQVSRAYWQHNRCPERIAKALDLSREAYDELFDQISLAIAVVSPDLATVLVGAPPSGGKTWQLQRAEIVAGTVLETLSTQFVLKAK